MGFDISIAFDVNTEQLVNARNALQSLGQAASDLNAKQDKATKTSSALVQSTEELTAANTKAAAAANAAAEAITRVGEAAPRASKGAETAEVKLEKLQSQLSFMRDDLDLTSTGFTRSQAGVLAWAKSVGAGIDMLQEYTKVFDDMNKLMGNNPFDQSAKGMATLNNELRELERSSQLVKDGITLTSQQTKMLTRDLEALKQQNEALGKSALDGASEYERAFIEKAKAVNNLRAVAAEAEREEKERAKQAAAIAKEEERFYAAAAREYEEQERRKTEALQREEAKRLAIIENARKSVNDKLMSEWASGVGVKSPELSKMASGYEQEMKAQAAAAKVAADAINYLEQEQRKLAATTELMARGFTASSASALYKYKEALEATGASAMDVKQKLYLFEQDLIKRQDKSPFAQMRKDIKQVQEDTNHLARAISVQLGDVAVSLAGGMNPFLVMIQQGDQIRFAVQQAKDAGQDLSKVMQGAFASMFESFKLVGSVIKEFAVDGMRTLANSFSAPIKHMIELHSINNQLSSGLIDSAKAAELKARSSEILAGSMRTLNLVIRGGVLAAIALLAAAYVSLSREQDKVAKMNAQFGASFGATTQEALAMARGLREFGVSTEQAVEAMSGLMKAGKIGKESFQGIAVAASEANKWVGISIEETIKKFNELADDPMKVLSEFTIQTGYLSQAQLQLVRDHLEAGESAKAQAEAIKLLEDGYRQMASQAKQDMSDLGIAMNDLKDTTNTLWDAFKNSSSASAGIAIVTGAVKTLASAAIGALFGIESIATALIFLNDVAPVNLAIDAATGGPSVASKFAAFKSSLSDNAAESRKLLNELWGLGEAAEGAASGTGVLTEEQKKQRSEAEETKKKILGLKDAYKQSNNEYAKTVDVNTYVAKRLTEENEKMLKGATVAQRGAFFTSKEYHDASLRAQEKFTKEWEDANKKSAKSVASTYKVARDNELTETKKFYDSQLKGLQDIEKKKSQINKSEYESRIISFGEYLAREMQLVEESKNAQTAIINKAEAEYTAAINREKEEHQAAAASAIAAGGSAKAINEQLAQSIQNIENRTKSYSEAVKQQREALERATEAKYAKFYEEIAKQINASKDALEKFNETVEENARKRSEDLKNQRALMGLYGSEAAAYKASTSTMAGYRSEIDKVKKALDKATQSRIDLQKAIAADPNATDTQRKALKEMLRLEEQLREEHNEKLKNAQIDSNQAAMDAIEAYNLEVFKEIRDALSEDIYNALFEGGKSGGDALKSVLNKMFKNYVINVILNPIMGNIVGSVMGAFGFGGGGSGVQGSSGGLGGILNGASNLKTLYSGLTGGFATALGGGIATLGSTFGSAAITAFGNGMAMTAAQAAAAAQAYTAAGAAYAPVASAISGGASTGSALTTAAPWAAGAVALAAAFGAFRKTKVVDTGVMGTLGIEGGIHDFTQKRKSGSLFSGPKYTLVDEGVSSLDKPMQDAFSIMRTAAIDMGKILGLATDHLKDFTTVITLDSADSKSGTRGLNLMGLSDSEVQAKVQQALEQANNELAQQLIGTWESVTTTVEQKIASFARPENYTGNLDDRSSSFRVTTKQVTNSVYTPSEFAREGETAIETLTRLAQSLSTVNGTLDILGLKLYETSLAGADMASNLVDMFGGLEGFTTATSSYYQNFYSEEERFRKAGETVNAALKSIGVELDVFGGEAAKVQYRELVEKAFAEGNQELAAQLLQMSAAFSEVANAAEQATNATQSAKESILDFIGGLAKTSSSALKSAYSSMQSAESLLDKIRNGGNAKALKEQRLWAAISTANYQDQITMANELADLLLEKSKVEQENAKRMIDFGKSLLEYVKSLKIGQLSPLTTGEKLAGAAKQYSDTLKKAQGGDEDAMRQLQRASSSYLDLARTYFASSEDYTKIFNSVTGALESLGVSSQTEGEQQIELATQNLSQLKDLESIVSSAYGTAKTDFEVQKGLLQEQIDHLLSITGGIEAVRDILSGLSPKLAGQFNTGGTSGKPGGVAPPSFNTMAQQYIDIMGSKTPSSDVGYVSSYMANLDAAKWNEEYYNAMALLQKQEDRDRLTALFNRLAIMNGIKVNGSHKNGLDNVPFDGYVAELHKGERVLTATENRTYGGEMVSVNASLVARLDALTKEVMLLRKENREDARLQSSVTAKASELNAKTIVEGVSEAASKETYSNNLGAKLR